MCGQARFSYRSPIGHTKAGLPSGSRSCRRRGDDCRRGWLSRSVRWSSMADGFFALSPADRRDALEVAAARSLKCFSVLARALTANEIQQLSRKRRARFSVRCQRVSTVRRAWSVSAARTRSRNRVLRRSFAACSPATSGPSGRPSSGESLRVRLPPDSWRSRGSATRCAGLKTCRPMSPRRSKRKPAAARMCLW